MYIYWGKKERTKAIGNTAYFCKICNDITVFKVSERQQVSHLYLIPIGKYEFIHTKLKCSICSKVLVTNLESTEFNCQKSADLKSLKSYITKEQTYEWEAQKDEKIQIQKNPGSLTKEDRLDIIYKAFISFENQVALKFAQPGDIKMDKRFLPGCLTMIAIVFAMIYLSNTYPESTIGKYIYEETSLDGFAIGFVLIVCIGLSQLLWWAITAKSHYFKIEVYPNLIKSIAHIKPNLQELTLVQEKLKKEKMHMRKFSIPQLQLALSEYQIKK